MFKDISMVLGLRCNCVAINFKQKKERHTLEKYHLNGIDWNIDNLRKTLMNFIKKKKWERGKLWLICIKVTLLFTNTSCSSPTQLAYYVDDQSTFGYYAWVQDTHKWLMDDNISYNRPCKRQLFGEVIKKRLTKWYAFVWNIWFYEVIRIFVNNLILL